MYFWKIRKLKDKLKSVGLSQASVFLYIFIFVVFSQLFVEINCFIPRKNFSHAADYIQSIVDILCVGFGTYGCYYANGASAGRQFAERYFSIGLVVGLRFLVIFIPDNAWLWFCRRLPSWYWSREREKPSTSLFEHGNDVGIPHCNVLENGG